MHLRQPGLLEKTDWDGMSLERGWNSEGDGASRAEGGLQPTEGQCGSSPQSPAPASGVKAFPMRKPCVSCGCTEGRIETRNGQDTVFCNGCGKYQYNAPRVETGREKRTGSAIRALLGPRRRARIILRACGRCEPCGRRLNETPNGLQVAHIISIKKGLAMGMTEAELNSDENLCAACDECNQGIGEDVIPLKLAIAMVRARLER
jgi:hypothetical protein